MWRRTDKLHECVHLSNCMSQKKRIMTAWKPLLMKARLVSITIINNSTPILIIANQPTWKARGIVNLTFSSSGSWSSLRYFWSSTRYSRHRSFSFLILNLYFFTPLLCEGKVILIIIHISIMIGIIFIIILIIETALVLLLDLELLLLMPLLRSNVHIKIIEFIK